MSCPECDQPLIWYGMRWGEHSDTYHARVRRQHLTSLARMIRRESDLRWWAWEIAHRGLVGVMARSGVYRGLWCRSEVPFEFWDETDREETLKFLRSGASDWAQFRYNVDVNPATWRIRIYDDRRQAAVASAIGSTEAEGLHVSADTTADLDAYARGELDAAALRARTLARHARRTGRTP